MSRLVSLVALLACSPLALWGQVPDRDVNYLLSDEAPPGALGANRLSRWGMVGNYFQPVRIVGPEGLRVAVASAGGFSETEPAPYHAGMLVGPAYRLKVTGIPFRPGEELFPTIEVIDRLYPPPGEANRFAIPIVLTEEDLDLAAQGYLVTRIIYQEDPQTALPLVDKQDQQRYFDVRTSQNALQVADQLGRPVAVLRIGSRSVPNDPAQLTHFVYGGPPWQPLPVPSDGPAVAGKSPVRTLPHVARVPHAAPGTPNPGQQGPVQTRQSGPIAGGKAVDNVNETILR